MTSRSEAGAYVMPPPARGNGEQRTDGGNVQLMEARLLQLYSSLRALYRSNQELMQALQEHPQDTDFSQALEENWETMRNQRALATELATEIKRGGRPSYDMPSDICDMIIPAWKTTTTTTTVSSASGEERNQHNPTETEEGLYL